MTSRAVIAGLVEASWELIENSHFVIERYRAATVSLGYVGDSVLNSIGDVGFMIAGFLVAARVPAWASIVAGLAMELIALIAIRDNLTLNVLMLVHPLPAVLAWQGG